MLSAESYVWIVLAILFGVALLCSSCGFKNSFGFCLLDMAWPFLASGLRRCFSAV